MSCAYHLSQHPEKFDVTLIDAVDYCGGQAFSIPIDKQNHGASWLNQGVQGGSYIFHHTMTMFARHGFHADPVKLQVGCLSTGLINCSTEMSPGILWQGRQVLDQRLSYRASCAACQRGEAVPDDAQDRAMV